MLTTDATVEAGVLDGLLGRAVARSFERVMVDQAQGMADAAVLLANATAAAPTLRAGSDGSRRLRVGPDPAVRVPGRGPGPARPRRPQAGGGDRPRRRRPHRRPGRGQGGRRVGGLRAAVAAGLPSWPAVLDALGTAGVALVPDRVGVSFGPVTVVADGRAASHDERAAAAVAAKAQVDLAVDLGIGPAAATVTTTDLPPEALGRHGE